MESLSLSLLTTALANGLLYIGQKVFDDGVLGPPLEPLTKRIQSLVKWPNAAMEADQRLTQAVRTALQATKPSDDLTSIDQYILQLGFDQFSQANAAPLRQAAGRAILQMVEPRYELIPDDLLNGLRWPTSRRPLLAKFLYTLRCELAGHPQLGALIEYCDRADVRKSLNGISLDVAQTAVASTRTADYLRSLLLDRGYRFSIGLPHWFWFLNSVFLLF